MQHPIAISTEILYCIKSFSPMKYMRISIVVVILAIAFWSCKKETPAPAQSSLAGEWSISLFSPLGPSNQSLNFYTNTSGSGSFSPYGLAVGTGQIAKIKLIEAESGKYYMTINNLGNWVLDRNGRSGTYIAFEEKSSEKRPDNLFFFEKVFNTDSAYYIRSVADSAYIAYYLNFPNSTVFIKGTPSSSYENYTWVLRK